jgi:hypothetical protein
MRLSVRTGQANAAALTFTRHLSATCARAPNEVVRLVLVIPLRHALTREAPSPRCGGLQRGTLHINGYKPVPFSGYRKERLDREGPVRNKKSTQTKAATASVDGWVPQRGGSTR